MVILVPDDPLGLQKGNLLRELVWWRSCSSRAMLFAYSSSFRTSEVGLPLPCSACMCSRLFVSLSVMWIVSSSGSHAVAARGSETRVRELVRGFLCDLDQLRCSSTWLSFSPELARVIHETHHFTTPNQVLFASVRLHQPHHIV